MTATTTDNEQKLESVYASVSSPYKGTGADIYELCAEMRRTTRSTKATSSPSSACRPMPA